MKIRFILTFFVLIINISNLKADIIKENIDKNQKSFGAKPREKSRPKIVATR